MNYKTVEADEDDDDDDEKDDKLVIAYINFIKFVMKTVIQTNYTDLPEDFEDRIDIAVQIIVKFSSEINSVSISNKNTRSLLHGFVSQIHSKYTQPTDYYVPLKAKEMQNATDAIFKSLKLPRKEIWAPFLKSMFNGTNITLDLDKDLIYVDPLHVKYLFMITGFVSAIPDVFIELWVWWMTVNAIIINTTKEIREFYHKQTAPFKNLVLRTRYVEIAQR